MQYEYRTMAAFALSTAVNKYPVGQVGCQGAETNLFLYSSFSLLHTLPSPPLSSQQERCLQSSVVSLCLEQLEEPNPVLRQWLAICLGRLWQNFDSARWYGARDNAHEKLIGLLWDEIPDVSGHGLLAWLPIHLSLSAPLQVRAAAVFSLGTYVLNTSEDGTSEMRISIDQMVGSALLGLLNDGSSIVRKVTESLVKHHLGQMYYIAASVTVCTAVSC